MRVPSCLIVGLMPTIYLITAGRASPSEAVPISISPDDFGGHRRLLADGYQPDGECTVGLWKYNPYELSPSGHGQWQGFPFVPRSSNTPSTCFTVAALERPYGGLSNDISAFKVGGNCICDFFNNTDCSNPGLLFNAYNSEDLTLWEKDRGPWHDDAISSFRCRDYGYTTVILDTQPGPGHPDDTRMKISHGVVVSIDLISQEIINNCFLVPPQYTDNVYGYTLRPICDDRNSQSCWADGMTVQCSLFHDTECTNGPVYTEEDTSNRKEGMRNGFGKQHFSIPKDKVGLEPIKSTKCIGPFGPLMAPMIAPMVSHGPGRGIPIVT